MQGKGVHQWTIGSVTIDSDFTDIYLQENLLVSKVTGHQLIMTPPSSHGAGLTPQTRAEARLSRPVCLFVHRTNPTSSTDSFFQACFLSVLTVVLRDSEHKHQEVNTNTRTHKNQTNKPSEKAVWHFRNVHFGKQRMLSAAEIVSLWCLLCSFIVC